VSIAADEVVLFMLNHHYTQTREAIGFRSPALNQTMFSEGYIANEVITVLKRLYSRFEIRTQDAQFLYLEKPELWIPTNAGNKCCNYDVWVLFGDYPHPPKLPLPLFGEDKSSGVWEVLRHANMRLVISNINEKLCSTSTGILGGSWGPKTDIVFAPVHTMWPGCDGHSVGCDYNTLPMFFEYQSALSAMSPMEILDQPREYVVWNCVGVNTLESEHPNAYEVFFFRECLARLNQVGLNQVCLLQGPGYEAGTESLYACPTMLSEYDFNVTNIHHGSLSDQEFHDIITGAYCYLVNDHGRRAAMSVPLALANGVPVFCPDVYAGIDRIRSGRNINPHINSRPIQTHVNYYKYLSGDPDHIIPLAKTPHKRVQLSLDISPLLSIDAAEERYRAALACADHYRGDTQQ
jgi:hypothetical protein